MAACGPFLSRQQASPTPRSVQSSNWNDVSWSKRSWSIRAPKPAHTLLALMVGVWKARRRCLRRFSQIVMQESKTNLITLVDGSFLLYQGYYAMPPLTNRLGEPTGALHNFLLQLERISTVTDPSHMAVLFDSATASSARKRSLPAYKQNRFCPDDLRIQFAKAKEALNELGYRWMCSETHEADDLIATCVRAQPEDRFVKIASKDKDLLQLVNKKVNLIAVDPDGEHWRITGETEVMRRWGVRPDQMGYLLALMGDAVDVIPGVPGIGQMKGAALLQRFENLEGILRAAQDCTILGVAGISEKLRLNILKCQQIDKTDKQDN
ncbi:unnamed protein product [Durusdinium trenchii]|uniref:5'-3' exonuclease domain-containing protein n=1 Tax=Durusdinium trenchii TaxID=1381693 RepID=A0ABP0STE9_9DINO